MGLDVQQKQLILTSEISALVYGRGAEFVLVRLDIDEHDEITPYQLAERGLTFCGVFGFVEGQAVARLAKDNPQAIDIACNVVMPFAEIVAAHLRESTSAERLERLYRMDS